MRARHNEQARDNRAPRPSPGVRRRSGPSAFVVLSLRGDGARCPPLPYSRPPSSLEPGHTASRVETFLRLMSFCVRPESRVD